eukprot:TRINITY_DN869_c0_g2_i1.p1 TRINITY_DN869_c0_g2~~TRINITY_DN869_c0_g2_i1.p1  ORF type:complete len:780 (-),score=111.93 TRINITY_DN869_c0_g2_i1:7-2346(-)
MASTKKVKSLPVEQLRRPSPSEPVISRKDFASKKRILIKVGSCVLQNGGGTLALGRLGAIVDQISALMKRGMEVILVSSGAIAMGRGKLDGEHPAQNCNNPRAYAAAGQSALMGLYDNLFGTKQIVASQVLVTDSDFKNEMRIENLRMTINHLLGQGAVPILNENDVISTRSTPLRDARGKLFWDNDSLAALVASKMGVQVCIILTDVEGLYHCLPQPGEIPEVIHTFDPYERTFIIGEPSRLGRGGMQAKVDAALSGIARGVEAVVIASGYHPSTILKVIDGETVGTFFSLNPEPSSYTTAKAVAMACKSASRSLLMLSTQERSAIILELADRLVAKTNHILAENAADIADARKQAITPALLARLKLTPDKILTLANGLRQIARCDEPIGQTLKRTHLAAGLILEQQTVPIGLLLVIFESRPDVLPQVAALALKSGNGLLLKGGKEAVRSNRILHQIIVDSIHDVTHGKVDRATVSLVETRNEIKDLLQLDEHIDLIIPRGSSQLVKSIQTGTKIPVLGHSEGICHVFIDEACDMTKAVRIAVDSKIDYPAACNAAETILLHASLLDPVVVTMSDSDKNNNSENSENSAPSHSKAEALVLALRDAGVTIYAGPRASKALSLPPARSLSVEYGDLQCTIEIVDDVWDAVRHINTYGSGHTDVIVTENKDAASAFLNHVESACVFHNASSRFADGYRFGLGAEVGISTGKVHARGPVGIEGLMTQKWVMVSAAQDGHIVSEFTKGLRRFEHKAALKKRKEKKNDNEKKPNWQPTAELYLN